MDIGLFLEEPHVSINMSFYDFPGVIGVYELADDQYLVSSMKDSMIDYIQDFNCINPLTRIRMLPFTSGVPKSKLEQLGFLLSLTTSQHGESVSQLMQMIESKRYPLWFGLLCGRPSICQDGRRGNSFAILQRSTGLKQFRIDL